MVFIWPREFIDLLIKLLSFDVKFICHRRIYLFYIDVNRFDIDLKKYYSVWISYHVSVRVSRYHKTKNVSKIWLIISGVIRYSSILLSRSCSWSFCFYCTEKTSMFISVISWTTLISFPNCKTGLRVPNNNSVFIFIIESQGILRIPSWFHTFSALSFGVSRKIKKGYSYVCGHRRFSTIDDIHFFFRYLINLWFQIFCLPVFPPICLFFHQCSLI